MSGIVTIAEFKKLDPDKRFTGSFKVKIVKIEVPTEGKKYNQKWKRQSITIQDATGELKIGLFNGHIGKLVLGKTYEICNFKVGVYNGSNTPQLLAHTIIKEIVENKDEPIRHKTEEDGLKPVTNLDSKVAKYTEGEILILDEIERVLIKQDPTLKNNVQKLGMKMKLIYQGIADSDKYSRRGIE